MTAALLVLRLFLAAVFAAAALVKLSDRATFRATLSAFGVPWPFAGGMALALPLAELAVAVGLVVSGSSREAAAVAVALLAAFTLAVAGALATGRRPSCGCLGGDRAIRLRTLVRNLGLIAAALAVALGGAGEMLPIGAEVAIAAAVGLGVLAISAHRVLVRHGEALLRRDVVVAANADAGAAVVPVGASVVVAGLAMAVAASARPADDLQALREVLRGASPGLVSAGRRAAARTKAQAPSAPRGSRRAASAALAAERRLLLDLRLRVLALEIEDPRAENARRLAAESLALFAASLAKVRAVTDAGRKADRRDLVQAGKLLQEAVYRGSRAGFLLEP